MTNPRFFAFQILRRWTVQAEPPFLPEKTDAVWNALQPQHHAAALELLTGITRWRGTLDHIIASQLRQPIDHLEPTVRAALWLGAYQLLFQETADYAAVDTTVSLIRGITPAAGGLVNAVLRGITRLLPRTMKSQTAIPAHERLSRRSLEIDFQTRLFFNTDIFPDPVKAPSLHLSAARSHPVPFVQTLLKQYDPAQTADLLLRNNLRPVATLRVDADALDVPAGAGLAAHDTSPRFLVAAEGWNDAIEKLVAKGKLSPQDPTAAKPVRTLATLAAADTIGEPRRILDLCAGLGTKSIQLARQFPNAQITATDIDPEKLKCLETRAKQIGITNITTIPLDQLEKLPTSQDSRPKTHPYDLILLDVPCSNTGVMARRVQSRWRWPTLDHDQLAKLQQQLINQAAQLTAPGGTIVYSTCSILPGENQNRVAKAIAEIDGLTLIQEEATLPSTNTPATNMSDGGYFAILKIS